MQSICTTLHRVRVINRIISILNLPREYDTTIPQDSIRAFPLIDQIPVCVCTDGLPCIGRWVEPFYGRECAFLTEVVARIGADESGVDGVAEAVGVCVRG